MTQTTSTIRTEQNRVYYQANRDKRLAAARAWREANRDARREYDRVYYLGRYQYATDYARAASANTFAAKYGAEGRLTAADVRMVLDIGVCARCGATDRLSVDHVLPLSKGGPNTPANLQCLCVSCNATKGARA